MRFVNNEQAQAAARQLFSKGAAAKALGCDIEQFDAAAADDLGVRVETLSRHSEPALRNALEFRKWPIPRVVRNSAWYIRAEQLPRTALVLAAITAALLSLVLIPADFDIEATGTLQPQQRRD